jgi:hypothetical protein
LVEVSNQPVGPTCHGVKFSSSSSHGASSLRSWRTPWHVPVRLSSILPVQAVEAPLKCRVRFSSLLHRSLPFLSRSRSETRTEQGAHGRRAELLGAPPLRCVPARAGASESFSSVPGCSFHRQFFFSRLKSRSHRSPVPAVAMHSRRYRTCCFRARAATNWVRPVPLSLAMDSTRPELCPTATPQIVVDQQQSRRAYSRHDRRASSRRACRCSSASLAKLNRHHLPQVTAVQRGQSVVILRVPGALALRLCFRLVAPRRGRPNSGSFLAS